MKYLTVLLIVVSTLFVSCELFRSEKQRSQRRVSGSRSEKYSVNRQTFLRVAPPKLEDIRNKYLQCNVWSPDQGSTFKVGGKYACEIMIDNGSCLSDYAKAFYDDLQAFRRMSNGQIRGLKVAMDLTARANGLLLNVNHVQPGQIVTFYSLGNFDLWIPPKGQNADNLVSRILDGKVRYISGYIQ